MCIRDSIQGATRTSSKNDADTLLQFTRKVTPYKYNMTKPSSPLTAAKLTAVQLTPRSGIHVHRPAELVPDTGDDKTGPDTGGLITAHAHTATLF